MEKQNKDNLYEHELFNNSKLTSEEINNLAKFVVWNSVPDSKLLEQHDLINKLDCNQYLDKMRMLRLVTRDIENIHLYPIHKYEYTGEEIIKSATIYPQLLDVINIKEGTLTMAVILQISKTHPHVINKINLDNVIISLGEAIEIAKIGHLDIIHKMNKDLTNINIIEKFKIIKAHNYHIDILNKLNIFNENFDNSYYIREIIINGNFYEELNLSCLWQKDWLLILKHKPELKEYINIEIFINGDIYFLIELCILFPEFLKLIDNDNAKKITSLGWEMLFLEFSYEERLISLCDFSSLEERTWSILEFNRPDLLVYKN